MAIYLKHLYRFVRSPMEMSATLFLPVLLVGLFGVGMASAVASLPGAGSVFGQGYLAYMAPGAAVLAALSSAVMGGAVLLQERLSGVLRQYLVAPVPRSAILAGTLGGAVTKAVGQALLVLALAAAVGAGWQLRPGPCALALAGLAGFAAGFAGLAAALAARAPSMAAFHGVLTLLNVPLLFASNALYPLAVQPAWLVAFAWLNPVSYVVELLRLALVAGPVELLGPAGDVVVLAVFAAAGLALGVSGSRRWASPA